MKEHGLQKQMTIKHACMSCWLFSYFLQGYWVRQIDPESLLYAASIANLTFKCRFICNVCTVSYVTLSSYLRLLQYSLRNFDSTAQHIVHPRLHLTSYDELCGEIHDK